MSRGLEREALTRATLVWLKTGDDGPMLDAADRLAVIPPRPGPSRPERGKTTRRLRKRQAAQIQEAEWLLWGHLPRDRLGDCRKTRTSELCTYGLGRGIILISGGRESLATSTGRLERRKDSRHDRHDQHH